jgi:hypothetical protein
VFVSGTYRQAASSSATIGKGATEAANGDFDFEGDLRSVGGVTDIGADQSVAAPVVSGFSAAGVGATAAVRGAIDTSGSPTTYSVEYGPTTAYGSTSAATALPASAGPQRVAVALAGLTPGTTYDYHVVASGNGGQTDTGDLVFAQERVPVIVPPAGAPRLGGLHFSRTRFAVLSRRHRHGGTRIGYTDTEVGSGGTHCGPGTIGSSRFR